MHFQRGNQARQSHLQLSGKTTAEGQEGNGEGIRCEQIKQGGQNVWYNQEGAAWVAEVG